MDKGQKWAMVRFCVNTWTEDGKRDYELLKQDFFRTDFVHVGALDDGYTDALETHICDDYGEWLTDISLGEGVYEIVAELWGHFWSNVSYEGEHDGGFEAYLENVKVSQLSEFEVKFVLGEMTQDDFDAWVKSKQPGKTLEIKWKDS